MRKGVRAKDEDIVLVECAIESYKEDIAMCPKDYVDEADEVAYKAYEEVLSQGEVTP